MNADNSSSLPKHVADFISQVKQRCPDAAIEVSYQPYETEDAHLKVHPPADWTSDQCEQLAEDTAEMMSDLLLTTGLSVPILIIEPQDRIRAENEAILAALRQRAS